MLIDDHRHDGKKDRQQRGKRQRFGKRFADGMFVGDAGKSRCQNDDRQANQADFRQMQRQRNDQPEANNPLSDKTQAILTAAALTATIVEIL